MKINELNENAYLPKEKESNKIYQIKEAIWEVSDELSGARRGTKDVW